MEIPRILVIGSSNTDMVIQSAKLPAPGETVMGNRFFMNPGGKGANQAVAAARLGGSVSILVKTGNDLFGKQALQNLKKEGINTDYVIADAFHPSGVALIMVDGKGENSIVVAPGSNGFLEAADIAKAESVIHKAEFILMQLEIPLQTVDFITTLAFSIGKKIILNPAPAQHLSDEILKKTYLLTPNQTEASILSGIKVHDEQTAKEAAIILKKRGVQNVIITLGSEGAYILTDSISRLIPAPRVKAVDTTAAGDVFNGALVVALSEGKDMETAVMFACHSASIAVTRVGAQSSIPYRKEINSLV